MICIPRGRTWSGHPRLAGPARWRRGRPGRAGPGGEGIGHSTRRARQMPARVVFTAGFSRRYTGGVREFEVEAKNLRGVIKAMEQLYPGPGHHLGDAPNVAIDAALHEPAYFQPIRSGCEVFFIPKLEGG